MNQYQIIEPQLEWNGTLRPLDLSKVIGIALHHMSHPTWGYIDVHNFHKNVRKWAGGGYNYWISFKGEIIKMRGLNIAAGIKNHNLDLIHIGFQGDYELTNKQMPDEQFNAAVWLIKQLKDIIPTINIIGGHKDWASTQCPGKYFPLEEIKSIKYRTKEIKNTLDAVDYLVSKNKLSNPDYWKEHAQLGECVKGSQAEALLIKFANSVKEVE